MRFTSSIRVIFVVLAAAMLCLAQGSGAPAKSAKAVVEEFWNMETRGGRLTDEGWRAANSYFVRPIQEPRDKVILVINGVSGVWEPQIRDNEADVTVAISGGVWKIGPRMSITLSSRQSKTFLGYRVVLTSKHWEFTPDGQTLKEVSGAPEWRIDREYKTVYLTVEAAIRYLNQVHDNSTDPVIKKNVEQSLAILTRHR